MTQSTSRLARYREKAEEARVIAEGMGNSNARDTVLEVAATWDRLAAKFNFQQMLDLMYVIGCYELLAMVINSLQTHLEPGVEGIDAGVRARMYGG